MTIIIVVPASRFRLRRILGAGIFGDWVCRYCVCRRIWLPPQLRPSAAGGQCGCECKVGEDAHCSMAHSPTHPQSLPRPSARATGRAVAGVTGRGGPRWSGRWWLDSSSATGAAPPPGICWFSESVGDGIARGDGLEVRDGPGVGCAQIDVLRKKRMSPSYSPANRSMSPSSSMSEKSGKARS